MLVLTRKVGERILIGDGIVVELIRVRGAQSVQIGVTAGSQYKILRAEIEDRGDPERQVA